MNRSLFLVILALLLCGCGGDPAPASVPSATVAEVEAIAEEAAAMASLPDPAIPVVLECTAPGTAEDRGATAVVDYSNAADGYVMVKFFGECDTRLKVRVAGPSTTYTYNLPIGEWTVFPLSDGSGEYQVILYRNVSGDKYATEMTTVFSALLEDEFAPFLRPNQYVNYSNAPNTMAMGQTLCTGIEDPLKKVAVVYDYVVDNFVYDYDRAANVKSGYLPELDTVLAEKKGICFDYAAVMTAMLRSQQIPCKLVVGYADDLYHAWISVWTQENGWVDGAIFFDGQTWKRMDPTFASSSQRSDKIMDYIENGQYTAKYLY